MLALVIGYGIQAATRAAQLRADTNIKHIVVVDINAEHLNYAANAGYITFSNLDAAYQWLEVNHRREVFDILVDPSGLTTSPVLPQKTMIFSKPQIISKKAKQAMRDHIVICSLDYDNCGSNLFTYEPRMAYTQNSEKIIIEQESNFFKEHLKAITAGKQTILYVGSSRQDIRTDRAVSQRNKNGSCFGNFEIFASHMRW